jgi:hypothetical protein
MSTLLEHHENRIDLIYVDPPFFTNRKFAAQIVPAELPGDRRWALADGR